MTSQLTTWTLSVVAAVVIPRYLGAELVGRLHLANSLWALGLVVTAFGMNLALVKAVARDQTRIGPLLATSIAARLGIYIPVTIAIFGYALVADYSNELLVLLAIVGLGAAVQAVISSVTSILKGLDRVGAMSLANIVGRFLFVVGAVAFLMLGYSIYVVAAIGGIGFLTTVVLQLRALQSVRRELGDTSSLSVDLTSIRSLLTESLPYFWITVFIVAYLQIDTIIISLVVERDEVLGWYSVYDRLGGTLLFVPTVFMTAVYPTLTRLYDDAGGANGPEKHNRLTQKSFRILLLISVPAGFGIATIARPLIELLYGSDFTNAAPVLAVGGIVTSLTYLTTVLGMFLISMDRQRQWTRFIALGVALTIPLDLLLVPYFEANFDNGAIGGAVTYVITESVILMGAIYLLPRGALGPSSLWYAIRVTAAGLVMVAAIYPIRELNLALPIAVGAVIYVLMVLVLGLIDQEDRRLVSDNVPVLSRRKVRSEQ